MPTPVSGLRPDCPEDLALSVSRCLEKDPENRWPSADALRRALESRTVTGYRPTGLTRAAARPTASTRSPGTRGSSAQQGGALAPRAPLPRRSGGPDEWRDRLDRHMDRASRRMSRGGNDTPLPVPDTGEPMIVQKVRAEFTRWAAVCGGLFLVDVTTGSGIPSWSLGVAGIWAGFGLFPRYMKLWQAGYTWRDVLNRPAAPDAIAVPGGKQGKALLIPAPKQVEYGQNLAVIQQAHADRAAILKLLDRMTPAERGMLPEEVPATVESLYQRASELAKALHAMDTSMDLQAVDRIEERMRALEREPEDEERARRLNLLQRQRKTIEDLRSRREQLASQLESCILAMQNVRFDLLRLRSSDATAALGDLSTATRQAKALSRDVDNAIEAASEIREALQRE
jgi:serine/threonine-protein kinase